MSQNQSDYVQLHFEHPQTHFIVYKNEKYPVNFEVLKSSSKYFFEHQTEIINDPNIYLFENDPILDNSGQLKDDVVTFIKFFQFQPIQLTNENIAILHYLAQKYEIDQLIISTEEYIKKHQDEVCLKILIEEEKEGKNYNNFYEDIISQNLLKYLKDEDLLKLKVSTLYRIFENYEEIKQKNDDDEKEKNSFLLKVLSKYGREGSILFKFADFKYFDDESLNLLLNEYSNDFEFEFINSSLLKLFIEMKRIYKNECEEQAKFKSKSEIEYNEMKEKLNIEIAKKIEEIERLKEQLKESFSKDEQNERLKEELNKEIALKTEENEKLKEQLKEACIKAEQNEQFKEELNKEIALKIEENERLKEEVKEKEKFKEENIKLKIIISKYEKKETQCIDDLNIENEIHIFKDEEKNKKVLELIKYLLKEKKKNENHQGINDILFIKRNEDEIHIRSDEKLNISITNKDKILSMNEIDNEDIIFISCEMTEILNENKILNSIEMKKQLSEFPNVCFDLQYPSQNFESIFNEVISIKKRHKVSISIFYTGIESTDIRFRGNKHINFVRLDSTVTAIKSEGTKGSFEECSSLISIEIPSSVTSIGPYSFSRCSSLKNIEIPDAVTLIESHVFNGCSSLCCIKIPSSVTVIGSHSFDGCSSLKSINIPKLVKTIEIPSSVTSIGSYSFKECSSLESINIPLSVTYIGDEVFYGCSSLKSISIPSIGRNWFVGCTSLSSVNILSSITTIEPNAFNGCTSLSSINIPSSVTSIGSFAFNRCSSLPSINIPSSVRTIGSYAFNGCSSLTNINAPYSVISIGEMAFGNCYSLNRIEIPRSINYSNLGIDDEVTIIYI